MNTRLGWMPKRSWIVSTSVKVRIRSFQTSRLDPSAAQERTTSEQVVQLAVHRHDAQRDSRTGRGRRRCGRLASIAASSSQVSPCL